MTNEQLIAKFNPANSHNLTKTDLEQMRTLTTDEIKVLAEAYPGGGPNVKQYLVLYDTRVPDKKQLYNLSTWPKLYNLRKMNNLKHWQPFSFWDIFSRPKQKPMSGINTSNPNLVKSARRVTDLSADEASKQLKEAIEENQKQRTQTKSTGTKASEQAKPAAAKSATKPVSKPGANKTAAPKKEQQPKAPEPASSTLPDDQQFGDPDNDTEGEETE